MHWHDYLFCILIIIEDKQTLEVICNVVFPDEQSVKDINFDNVVITTPMGHEPGYVLSQEIIQSKSNITSCQLTYNFEDTVLFGRYTLTFEDLLEKDKHPKEISFIIDKYNDSLKIPLNKTVFRTKVNSPTKYQLDLLEAELTESSLVITHKFSDDFQVVGGNVLITFLDGSGFNFNHNKDIDIDGIFDYETGLGHTIYTFDKIDLATVESISICGETFNLLFQCKTIKVE